MQLTAAQQDALIELLNIGFGRAAASLSQLTGHRVILDAEGDGRNRLGLLAKVGDLGLGAQQLRIGHRPN